MPLVPRQLTPLDAEALAAVQGVLRAAERVDGTPPISDQALLAASLGARQLYAYTSAAEGTDASSPAPIAVAVLGAGEIDLVVHPESRGSGVGSEVLQHLLSTVDRDANPGLRAWSHGDAPAPRALLSRAGFTPARTLFRLALDPTALQAAIAQARAMPAGFTMRPYAADRPTDAAEWVRVNAAAFADHPEQGAVTLTEFTALTGEPWFDPADLMLAWDAATDDLAGYAWVKTLRTEHGVDTELYVLGVDPAYAGRGLGAGLLGETLRRMATHQPDRITLHVDGTNAQARDIYDRVGFVVDSVSTQWVRNSG